MQKRLSVTLKGAILSLLVTFMLSTLLAALVCYGDVPDNAIIALIFFIAALSCMTGAYAISKALGSKGLLTGAGMSILYYIVLYLVSVILNKGVAANTHMLIMLVAVIASGMLGGVLGMPR
ncbi:MAG: TIGR04086 family membrane protein [Clostridia bacterium]|nr:TIGR04086 family membrane protein [Clostridia bacterium]